MGQDDQTRDPFVTFARIDALRRKAWRELGVISLRIEELPVDLQQQMKDWAEREYGKR
jgi:hypothetical protein